MIRNGQFWAVATSRCKKRFKKTQVQEETDTVADCAGTATDSSVRKPGATKSHSVEVGTALCVQSHTDADCEVVPLTSSKLAAQDERELAVAECEAELAGHSLYSEDERLSENSECNLSPGHGGCYYAYKRAG
eukprot:3051657-Pleurochrysis_carterae.AAC.1